MKLKSFLICIAILLTTALGTFTAVALNKYEPTYTYYTVIFVSESGEFLTSVDVPEGATVEAPNHPTRKNQRFVGWSRSGGDIWNFKTDTVYSNLILMAEFEDAKTYTVTFDTDGGSEVEVQYVAEGDKIQIPKNPSKEGLLFDSWFLGDEEWNFERYPVTHNLTLKARWKLIIPIHPTNP